MSWRSRPPLNSARLSSSLARSSSRSIALDLGVMNEPSLLKPSKNIERKPVFKIRKMALANRKLMPAKKERFTNSIHDNDKAYFAISHATSNRRKTILFLAIKLPPLTSRQEKAPKALFPAFFTKNLFRNHFRPLHVWIAVEWIHDILDLR